ncbi:hypothetical protein ACFVAJ_16320 [Agromyces sp. NPDC057679]|uniref:hypothetical protein n=1 Tax=Agromyces sp. NPDC057679 TaxID=3346207 RepID=UPI0036719B81
MTNNINDSLQPIDLSKPVVDGPEVSESGAEDTNISKSSRNSFVMELALEGAARRYPDGVPASVLKAVSKELGQSKRRVDFGIFDMGLWGLLAVFLITTAAYNITELIITRG